jgi:hypothetical protein
VERVWGGSGVRGVMLRGVLVDSKKKKEKKKKKTHIFPFHF